MKLTGLNAKLCKLNLNIFKNKSLEKVFGALESL